MLLSDDSVIMLLMIICIEDENKCVVLNIIIFKSVGGHILSAASEIVNNILLGFN